MKDTSAFEKSVFDSLKKLLAQCGRELGGVKTLGVAVSGGADSVALLVSLYEFCKKNSNLNSQFSIKAVTVDHSMRPDNAGAKDAAFVVSLCKSLGVECVVKKIPQGIVAAAAKERGRGTEEAARFLRYNTFKEFAAETSAEFICLAHNKNDALETLLMRFLQGSGVESAGGIAAVRGIYLRPLLETSRAQIEEYLKAKNISWRTDATNSDNNYLRNKIRNKLVPFLDENFEGWQKAVLQGGEKAVLQNDALQQLMLNSEELIIGVQKPQGVGGQKSLQEEIGAGGQKSLQEEIGFDAANFGALPVALRQKMIYDAVDSLGIARRVPYSFVRTLAFWPEQDFKNLNAAGVEASTKKSRLFLKKTKKIATESGFFDIIETEGVFEFEDFLLDVKADSAEFLPRDSACTKISVMAKTPFVVRSRQFGDEVFAADGTLKSLADIFSDWKIPEGERDRIPLLVMDAKIAAVIGSVLGYDNWIVVN